MSAKVIAIINQKGGVGKTFTAVNTAAGLAKKNHRVLLIDLDPQGSATISLGFHEPDKIETTICDIMESLIQADPFDETEPVQAADGIQIHEEEIREYGTVRTIRFDLMPSNINLAGMEPLLTATISCDRNQVLKRYVNIVKEHYDEILIDCPPSLGFLTTNALVAASEVLIPVQADYLPIKGLELLFRTTMSVKRNYNPTLEINGIVITMAETRSNVSRSTLRLLNGSYGQNYRIYETMIPASVRARECAIAGQSIFAYEPKSKIGEAYSMFVEELING